MRGQARNDGRRTDEGSSPDGARRHKAQRGDEARLGFGRDQVSLIGGGDMWLKKFGIAGSDISQQSFNLSNWSHEAGGRAMRWERSVREHLPVPTDWGMPPTANCSEK